MTSTRRCLPNSCTRTRALLAGRYHIKNALTQCCHARPYAPPAANSPLVLGRNFQHVTEEPLCPIPTPKKPHRCQRSIARPRGGAAAKFFTTVPTCSQSLHKTSQLFLPQTLAAAGRLPWRRHRAHTRIVPPCDNPKKSVDHLTIFLRDNNSFDGVFSV